MAGQWPDAGLFRSLLSWSDFQAIGTDRWLRNRGKRRIQSGDLIQSDRNPLQTDR